MADAKISALTAATVPLSEADEFALIQSTTSKMATLAQIMDAAKPEGYDLGTVAVLDSEYLIQFQELRVSGTGVLSVAGTGLVILTDFGTKISAPGPVVGSPKGGSFTVPDNYVYDLLRPLVLSGDSTQVTLQGSAELVLSDDFGSRSLVVLAGVA